MAKRVLITGGSSQVGLELADFIWPNDIELVIPSRAELDLTSPQSLSDCVLSKNVDCVINCAAWTAVDDAEGQLGNCFLTNAQGPAWLAEATNQARAALIHISTDYVFDGMLDQPYQEGDAPGPVNVYGASKLAGEYAVRMGNPRSVVIRTAWILSRHRANFLKTMLRLGEERDELFVISDQFGCPTSAKDVAEAVKIVALRHLEDPAAPVGIYHFVNSGEASWYELATTIFNNAVHFGAMAPKVTGIEASAFPSRARRPANSRLNTTRITADFGIVPRPWEVAIEEIVRELFTEAQGSNPNLENGR